MFWAAHMAPMTALQPAKGSPREDGWPNAHSSSAGGRLLPSSSSSDGCCSGLAIRNGSEKGKVEGASEEEEDEAAGESEKSPLSSSSVVVVYATTPEFGDEMRRAHAPDSTLSWKSLEDKTLRKPSPELVKKIRTRKFNYTFKLP